MLLDLLEFVSKPAGLGLYFNSWFISSEFKVYLRNSFKFVDNEYQSAIVIATIEVNPLNRNQGYYTALLNILENFTKNKIIYIENVLSFEDYSFYLKRDFKLLKESDFYKYVHFN